MTTTEAARGMRRATLATVCLLIGAPCPAGPDEPALERLFFTPERRQQLDRQRELNILDRQQVPNDPTLTIDGVVTRSSGRRTAWINGSAQHDDDPASGLTVTTRRGDPGKVLLEANDAPAARARVGETVNRNTGEARDLLNGGQLRVHGRPPATRQALE
jgi:hypothetical protein